MDIQDLNVSHAAYNSGICWLLLLSLLGRKQGHGEGHWHRWEWAIRYGRFMKELAFEGPAGCIGEMDVLARFLGNTVTQYIIFICPMR